MARTLGRAETEQFPFAFLSIFPMDERGKWQPYGLTEGKMPRPKATRDTARARELRQKMSLPETLLWNLLRKSPAGVVFRRQHPVGTYVVDFYCARAKVCIEIDGIGHDMGTNPERDVERDAWLRAHGLEVARILASDVLREPERIAEALVRYCSRD